jgi:hypothetical protein
MRKYRHARRLALLALSCLPCGRYCRPIRVGLVARTRYRILAAGLKRAREEAGGGTHLVGEAAAALALALRVVIASVLEALRTGRKAATVRRPERFALPVIEVVQPDAELQQGKDMFVATPRKDSRRPGKVRMTYRPFTGQPLKPGEYLATKVGRRYKKGKGGEAAAA